MNEIYWPVLLVVNFAAVLAAYKLWGKTGLYVWIPISTILANIQVLKTIEIFGMTATLGNIVYASAFLVTDILNEKYGKPSAVRAVYLGFFSIIAAAVIMNLALLFEPAPGDFAHEHLVPLFSLLPRIGAASLAAYYVSQLHDVWAYQFWKKRYSSAKNLWLWNNASTMVSQLIDTLVFTTAAFAWVYPWRTVMEIMLTTYVLKWVVALLDTPVLYIARAMVPRGEDREVR